MRIMRWCQSVNYGRSRGEKLEQTRRPRLVQARPFPGRSRPMHKIESVSAMRLHAAQLKRESRTTALVITNGALHAGHAALIAAAKAQANVVMVSSFPNPLSFGPSENFAGYP